jgi:branched-chain amino acid transport system permease protein
MVGAYIIFAATSTLGMAALWATLLAVSITGLLGIAIYKLCYERVRQHETAVMIIAIALTILLQEILLIIFGGHFRGITPFMRGFFEIAGTRVSYQQVLAIIASFLVLGGLWALLSRTRLGNAIRAVAQDRETANLMGINVNQTCLITMGISSALAGLAAAIVAPILTVQPFMWQHPLIIILAAVILGGLGSVKGSIMGAFVLGFTEAAVILLVPGGAFLRGAASLGIMVLILLIRPEGLFGVVFEEERL